MLHNYHRDEEDDQEWLHEIDHEEGEDDLAAEATTSSNTPDYARRDELFYYLSELEETTIN